MAQVVECLLGKHKTSIAQIPALPKPQQQQQKKKELAIRKQVV
jgi:hypothetical protein